ncbi:MAG: hypothetical protein O2931_14665 [Planctomycetota bacterium]|nr:hypothetical protein [Planctomycetota bacterium]
MRTVLAALLTLAALHIGGAAIAQSIPQACFDSTRQVNDTDEYEAAILSATRCLEQGSGGHPAIAYHNRASARLLHWWHNLDVETPEADRVLEAAWDDIERAIELDPRDGLSYCIRANIIYNLSWGADGYDDIDRGLKLGAPENKCFLWE